MHEFANRLPLDLLDIMGRKDVPAPSKPVGDSAKDAARKPTQKRAKPEDEFLVLVPDDQLHFRVTPPAVGPRSIAAAPNGSDTQIKRVADNFRNAFVTVWNGLARPDQVAMLNYWSRPTRTVFADQRLPKFVPLIELKQDVSPEAEPIDIGVGAYELHFEYAVALDQPARLPDLIALTLAYVYRYAIRQHLLIYITMVLDPLAEWQRTSGPVSDDARDQKEEELEEAWYLVHKAEMKVVLDRWGWPQAAEYLERKPREGDAVLPADVPAPAVAENNTKLPTAPIPSTATSGLVEGDRSHFGPEPRIADVAQHRDRRPRRG